MSNNPYGRRGDRHLAMSNNPYERQDRFVASSSNQTIQHIPHDNQNHKHIPHDNQNHKNIPHDNQNHNEGRDQNHNAEQSPYPKRPPLHMRQRKRTSILARCITAVCIIFWLVVILLGLAVLIVYLVYRPRSPQFEIADASLNAGYIDTGNLLNADITLLANVINPNTKVDIYFSYSQLDMYFQGIMIGTQIIEAFYEPRGVRVLRSLHIVTSEVALPLQVAQEWGNGTQAGGGGVALQVSAKFKTRWLFGRWLRYTNHFDPTCNILVGPPPNGAILRKQSC